MPGPPLARAAAARPALRHGDLIIDRDRHEVRQAGHPVALTVAEFRVLDALVEAEGRVLSRERLLDALYGNSQGEALDRTIDVHIGRLRDKLADNPDRPRYIATVRGAGYRAVSQQER
jgi:DNA-binding response OmpR family regulator